MASKRLGRLPPPSDRGASAALTALVVLVVVAPWPMGGAPPWAARSLTVVALGASALVLGYQTLRGRASLPPIAYWPIGGLVALSAGQLVLLPSRLHAALAPGSYSVWHPSEPVAAAVLGSGWRPVSVHPSATIEWTAWTMGLLTLSALAAPALKQRRLAARATVVVVLGGLMVAVYGIVARTLFGSLLFGRVPVPTVSPFGPFVSKNHFAGYVEMVALLALGWALGLMDEARRGPGTLSWVGSSRAGRVVGALGVAAALALAVPVSQSRGGVLSLGAGLATLFLLRARGRESSAPHGRRWLGPAVGLLLLLIALQVVLPQEAHQRMATLTSTSPDASGAYRLGLWRDALRAFGSSPIVGQGLGAFADALPRFKRGAGELRVEHAENDYCELFVEGGLVAALTVAAFLWLLLRSGGPASPRRGLEDSLRLGAIAAGAALAVHSLVDFNLHIPGSASLACFLLALLSARAGTRFLEGNRARAFGAAGLLALALATAGLSWPLPASEALALAGSGTRDLRARHFEAKLRTHLRERPADAEAWAWLAWLRMRAGARDDGVALAAYASRLDPTRRSLVAYSKSLARSQAQ